MTACITTKYLGATNHRGARIKASLESGASAIVAYDYALDQGANHSAAAETLCLNAITAGATWPMQEWVGAESGQGFVFVPAYPIRFKLP